MKASLLLTFLFLSIFSFAREKKSIYYPGGKVQYEYETEGQVLDGKFVCYYETGRLKMKGQFSLNQKTGLWRVWDERGKLRSERNFSDNEHFTQLNLWDSTGVKTKPESVQAPHTNCDFNGRLFMHRYISLIEKKDPENFTLFTEQGLIASLLQSAKLGESTVFTDNRFVQPIDTKELPCFDFRDVVAISFKEEYVCCADNQTMKNRIMGIAPVVMVNGVKKELFWFYTPDIKANLEDLEKIREHLFTSTITHTTVNDLSFRFREVDQKENDPLRLMLVEFEANAILYTSDQNLSAVSSVR